MEKIDISKLPQIENSFLSLLNKSEQQIKDETLDVYIKSMASCLLTLGVTSVRQTIEVGGKSYLFHTSIAEPGK